MGSQRLWIPTPVLDVNPKTIYYLKRSSANYRTGDRKGRSLFFPPQIGTSRKLMEKLRSLVVDNNDGQRATLAGGLGNLGHDVVATGDREAALGRDDLDGFDVIISDLTEEAGSDNPISELQRKRLLTPI